MNDTLYRSVPAAVRSIDPLRHAVVEASAGTGKTYTIEHLVAGLIIERGVPLERILVVTFTEKAARELRERVRRILETIVESSNPSPSGEGDWVIDDAARARIEVARASFDRAPISTIHGFCQRVLGELAIDTGAELGSELLSDDHLFARSWRACLREELLLDPALGDVITRHAAEGADALLEKVRKAIDLDAAGHRPALDAWARRVFPEWLQLLDVDDVAAALAKQKDVEADHVEQVRSALAELVAQPDEDGAWAHYLAFDGELLAPLFTKDGSKVRAHLPGAVAPWIEIDRRCAVARPDELTRLVEAIAPRVAARYARDKQEIGAIEFDDMLSLVRDALRGPRGDRVAAALSARFDYALIDEFQDTDDVQWDIFRAAFIEPGHTRVFLIGDPKQAIYRFRGADVHVYRDAVEMLEREHDAVSVPLDRNFRSRPSLIDAYNEMLRVDAEPSVFTGDVNRYDHPVLPGRDEDWLRVTDAAGNNVSPVLTLSWTGDPDLAVGELRNELAACMATQLREMTYGDSALQLAYADRPARSLRPSDVLILVTSWKEARPVQAALDAVGVPWALARAEGLMSSTEARALHTLLCALASPHETRWALAAWHTPIFGLSVDELDALRDADVDHPAVAMLLRWSDLARQQRWAELFDDVLFASGLVRRLLVSRDDERAVTNYLHLSELLAGYAEQHRLDAASLAERLRGWITGIDKLKQGDDEQRLESERDAVQIMTMHASKGLEAPVVCCFGGLGGRGSGGDAWQRIRLDGERLVVPKDALTPQLKEAAKREAREENERLDYVALTRAGARLVLPAVASKKVKADGVWYPINERLLRLLEEHDGAPPGHEVVDATGAAVMPDADALAALSTWRPADGLTPPTPRVREERVHHRARRVTPQVSYSSLRRRGSTGAPVDAPDDAGVDDPRADAVDAPTAADDTTFPIDAVPGGADTGLCLHEIAELADLSAVAGADDASAWLATDGARELCTRAARRHGVSPELSDVVGSAAFDMLRTPLLLPGSDGGVTVEQGLASVDRMEREVEFMMALRRDDASQGYVKGYIDAVACHDGRWYVIDWKSDRLERWTQASVRAHVDAHYGVQRMLYLMALARILDVRDAVDWEARIGGWVYVFARGLPRGAGVASGYASWDDVRRFEAELTDEVASRGLGRREP